MPCTGQLGGRALLLLVSAVWLYNTIQKGQYGLYNIWGPYGIYAALLLTCRKAVVDES